MEILLGICLGFSLAAACGFRVFVPLLVMSIASRTGHLALGSGFAWIGSVPALVMFAVAAGVELAAYFVPWLDNALDTIATPAAVIAGIVVMAACVSGTSPLLTWTLAVVAGGGAAGIVQGVTVVARGASSATTGGAGNPVVSTAEAGGSVLVSVLAVAVPVVAGLAVILLLVYALRRIGGGFRRRREARG
jgi:hypothetical protein